MRIRVIEEVNHYLKDRKVDEEISGVTVGDVLEFVTDYFENGSLATFRFLRLENVPGASIPFLNLQTLEVERVSSTAIATNLPIKNIISYGVYSAEDVQIQLTNLIKM